MDYCPACGRLMDSVVCPSCGVTADDDDSPVIDAARAVPEVFLVRVCDVCNGVLAISCTCEHGDPARPASTDGARSRLKRLLRAVVGRGAAHDAGP